MKTNLVFSHSLWKTVQKSRGSPPTCKENLAGANINTTGSEGPSTGGAECSLKELKPLEHPTMEQVFLGGQEKAYEEDP